MIWYFMLFLVVVAPLLWWILWQADFDGIQTQAIIQQRTKLTYDEFYEQFYADSDIPKSTIVRLLEITAVQFGVDSGQIRPGDNFLQSTLGDTIYYVTEISEEFGIRDWTTHDNDSNSTFDDIAQWIHCQLRRTV